MSRKRDDQMSRLQDFLVNLDRLKESGLIFSSTILKRDVAKAVKQFFGSRTFVTVEDSMEIKENIDEIFMKSLKTATPIFIAVSVQISPVVIRRLEQLLSDGYLDESLPEGRTSVKPAPGWFSVVWVDSSEMKDKEFPLRELFGYRLSL